MPLRRNRLHRRGSCSSTSPAATRPWPSHGPTRACDEPSTRVEVVRLDRPVPLGTAIAHGIEALEPLGDPADAWVWVLHEDAAATPSTLARLLAAGQGSRSVGIAGPKIVTWDDSRRLVELGIQVTHTGRRLAAPVSGEADQGQYDGREDVLAVGTDGMLLRRSVWDELGGFDRSFLEHGAALDLGWRAAAAGYRTVAVPQAVVFHAEAAHRGTRRTPLTGRHTHYQERRAALFTLLANGRPRRLPCRWSG